MARDTETLEGMVDADPMAAIHAEASIDEVFDDLDSPSIVIGIGSLRCDESLMASLDFKTEAER